MFGYIVKSENITYSDYITVLHTVQATPDYSLNDMIGIAMEIPLAGRLKNGRALLTDITITDVAAVTGAVDFEFFMLQPTTGSDNSAVSITKTSGNSLGKYSFTSTFTSVGGYSIATATGVNKIIKCGAGASSIWYVLTDRSGTLNYTATTNLEIGFGFSQE